MSAKKERAANFRTYEAQARLLAAVVASLPKNFRFDYKTIAKHVGGRTTESAIEHRFRPLRVQADALREMVSAGADPMGFPVFDWKTANDIQKYFGESTQEGIAFQFRWIKKSAEVCKTAADNGQSPVEAFRGLMESGNGSRAAVAGAGPAMTPAAKRVRAASKTNATPASKRRKAQEPAEAEDGFDAGSEHGLVLSSVGEEESSSDADFSGMDATPTRAKPKAATKTTQGVDREVAAAKQTPRQVAALPRRAAPAPTPAAAAASSRASFAPRPAQPAVLNGFTNPAAGLAFHDAPRSTATPSSASTPAAASSSAATTPLDAVRRSSVVTIDSSSSASRPVTPNDTAQHATTFPCSAASTTFSDWNAYAPNAGPATAASTSADGLTMPRATTREGPFATSASGPSFSTSAAADAADDDDDDDDENFFAFMNRDAVVESAPHANFGGFRGDAGDEEEDEDAGDV
ncbi:hypothetical protein VTJ83DRAFT_5775 [Remersonia thermophila]|uniref:Uncharacterized protein n=1 Tax=Remersonia thermophila TaxID=72144 RepID=A0ABR4D7T0_9PEZI